VVRPLLCVRRADIEDYLSAVGESFVVDSTNLQSDYKRNKIRNIVMPTLLREFPGADQAILDTLANLRGDLAVFRAAVDCRRDQLCHADGNLLHIDLDELLRSEHPATLFHEFLHPYGFTSSQLEDMLRDGLPGALFEANGYVAERSRGEIIVAPDVADDAEFAFSLDDVSALPIKLDCAVVERTADFRFDGGAAVAYFDEKILDAKLTLRHWRQGDRFQPFGMKGWKKLSDYFSDNKFSIIQKRKTWLLCEEDKILWIVGHRAAGHYAVGGETKKVVVLSLYE
ncbi:MAG: tRNA lysidine(34) synthetase TilS, partial [Bacteroidales bacterium]|nr:tRNA lysidine(34) synthetase TilS [Bacteroidales bacterium]